MENTMIELTGYINKLLNSTTRMSGRYNEMDVFLMFKAEKIKPTKENAVILLLNYSYNKGFIFGQKDIKHKFKNLMEISHS